MGLLSNLLLPGRLRTGPTVLLPAKVKPEALLEAVQLADPAATQAGDELLAAGTRIHAPLELTADLLRKLSIEDEERLWAYRVVAERPLPMDYYDKILAAGLAYRYGGWSLCQGSADDPAEDESRLAAVYLPEMPDQEELATLLRGLLRLKETSDETDTGAEAEADSEAEEGAGAESGESETAEPQASGSDAADDDSDSATDTGVQSEVQSEVAAAEAADSGDETAEASADSAVESAEEEVRKDGLAQTRVAQNIVYTGADLQVTASYESRFPAVVAGLMPYATEVVRIAVRAAEDGELAGDDVVVEAGKVALALGNALDGPVVDMWGFQVLEVADLLPARRA